MLSGRPVRRLPSPVSEELVQGLNPSGSGSEPLHHGIGVVLVNPPALHHAVQSLLQESLAQKGPPPQIGNNIGFLVNPRQYFVSLVLGKLPLLHQAVDQTLKGAVRAEVPRAILSRGTSARYGAWSCPNVAEATAY